MQNLKLHIATLQLSSVLLAATVYLLESYLARLHKSNPASTNYEDSCEMQGEELKAVERVWKSQVKGPFVFSAVVGFLL